jgi:hypothetical protein
MGLTLIHFTYYILLYTTLTIRTIEDKVTNRIPAIIQITTARHGHNTAAIRTSNAR